MKKVIKKVLCGIIVLYFTIIQFIPFKINLIILSLVSLLIIIGVFIFEIYKYRTCLYLADGTVVDYTYNTDGNPIQSIVSYKVDGKEYTSKKYILHNIHDEVYIYYNYRHPNIAIIGEPTKKNIVYSGLGILCLLIWLYVLLYL